MKRIIHCLVLMLAFFVGTGIVGASETPSFELPLLITGTGQTPCSLTLHTLAGRLGIQATYDPMIARVSGYETVAVAMGASLKGMGAAGINQEEELERSKVMFERAKASGAKIIGFHIGEEARRNDIADRYIEPFLPLCDLLVVLEKGNQDDLFTKASETHGVPLIVVADIAELMSLVAEMFE